MVGDWSGLLLDLCASMSERVCVCVYSTVQNVLSFVIGCTSSFPSPDLPARRHLSPSLARPPWCGVAPRGCSSLVGRWRQGAPSGLFGPCKGPVEVWPPCVFEPECCWGRRRPWWTAGNAGQPSADGSFLSSGRRAPRPWVSSLWAGREGNKITAFSKGI